MIRSLWNRDTTLPDHVLIDSLVVELNTRLYWHNGESRFEQKNWDGLHEHNAINLVAIVSLLTPHTSEEDIFILEYKRHNSNKHINGSLKLLNKLIVV